MTEKPPAAALSPYRVLTDPIVASLVFVLAASVVFLAFPAIDLQVSALFYDKATRFGLSQARALQFFRNTNDIFLIASIVLLTGSLIGKIALPDRPSLVPPNVVSFLLWSLVIGPGLVVNAFLKPTWGRPRPVMVQDFGGAAPHVEVWHISDYCVGNCSFVSGETASAVWLAGMAFVLPKRWQPLGFVVGGIYAALISANRIAFGGHFLSDVLLSFGVVSLVMAVLYRVIVERPLPVFRNDVVEARLARIGYLLRGRRTSGPGA